MGIQSTEETKTLDNGVTCRKVIHTDKEGVVTRETWNYLPGTDLPQIKTLKEAKDMVVKCQTIRGKSPYKRLFLETFRGQILLNKVMEGNEILPVFSLNSMSERTEGCFSLYHLWLEATDEWSFVQDILSGNMMLWESMLGSAWFRDPNAYQEKYIKSHRGIKAWRRDHALRDASLAQRKMLESDSPSSVNKLSDISRKTAEKGSIFDYEVKQLSETQCAADKKRAGEMNADAVSASISSIASRMNKGTLAGG